MEIALVMMATLDWTAVSVMMATIVLEMSVEV